jgi:hypothetical protein
MLQGTQDHLKSKSAAWADGRAFDGFHLRAARSMEYWYKACSCRLFLAAVPRVEVPPSPRTASAART